MVKLTYKGRMGIGRAVCDGFSMIVHKGKTYEIPESIAIKLLQGDSWVKPEQKEFKKKKKEEKIIIEEDD